jgi:hypothetical protein
MDYVNTHPSQEEEAYQVASRRGGGEQRDVHPGKTKLAQKNKKNTLQLETDYPMVESSSNIKELMRKSRERQKQSQGQFRQPGQRSALNAGRAAPGGAYPGPPGPGQGFG